MGGLGEEDDRGLEMAFAEVAGGGLVLSLIFQYFLAWSDGMRRSII